MTIDILSVHADLSPGTVGKGKWTVPCLGHSIDCAPISVHHLAITLRTSDNIKHGSHILKPSNYIIEVFLLEIGNSVFTRVNDLCKISDAPRNVID